MPLDTPTLNQLIFDAFTGKTTWLEASTRYPLEDFIAAFKQTRATMLRTMEGTTDAQVAYTDPSNPLWSLSETVTHLMYTQNLYHNCLVDISNVQLPHMAEAARGLGEGAKLGISADALRQDLQKATSRIVDILEKTRVAADPVRTTSNAFFGTMTYTTWVLAMLGHEVDHVRQAIVMRRLAKAAQPG